MSSPLSALRTRNTYLTVVSSNATQTWSTSDFCVQIVLTILYTCSHQHSWLKPYV